MVTLKQLAEQLNVSVSTVSKALHDSDEISPDTIARVKALAKHLNYKPNKLAVSLKNSKTYTIGVIIPNILNHFFAKALYAIEMEATKYGYNIITCVSNESMAKEAESLQLLSNGSVDGFIFSLAEETQVSNELEHIETILQQRVPVVIFDRVSDDLVCDKVILEDFSAAKRTTEYLIAEGRKRIALIGDIDNLSVGKERTNGYLNAISEAKDYNNEPLVVTVKPEGCLEEAVNALFENHKDVDGVVCIDNQTGVVVLHRALRLGIDIPNDLSIIGFSDENVLQFTNPKLSTVSQHTIEIGQTAVNMLINRLNGKVDIPAKTKVIKANMILRETTKPVD